MYTSSHYHTKIIKKLQSNQHTELPEVWLTRSPTSRDKNKRSPQTGMGGGDTKGRGPTTKCSCENWEGYLECRVLSPTRGVTVWAPHWDPQPRVPELGREVPITPGCENQQRLQLSEMEGCTSCGHSS